MSDPVRNSSRTLRYGAFDAAGRRVATFVLDVDASTITGSGSVDLQDAIEAALARVDSSANSDLAYLGDLLAAEFTPLELSVRRIPAADIVFNGQLDAKSGMFAGRSTVSEGVEALPAALQKRIADSISSVGTRLADELADEIEKLKDEPAQAAGALRVAQADGRLGLQPSRRLGDALAAIDADALGDEASRDLLTLRVMVDTRLDRYAEAGRDARTLLRRWKDYPPTLAAEFRNIEAVAHAKAGRAETAITIWTELAHETPGVSAGQRAQMLRNLAFAAPAHDPRALEWIELSADAYLQAGERREAAINHVHWGDMLEHHDAGKAVAMLESAGALLDEGGPIGDALRAALQFARAQRLAALERLPEALTAAIEAVEARRGLAGQEEELLASLALAEMLARRLDDTRAVDLAKESATLLVEIPNQRFLLGARIDALLRSWNGESADHIRIALAASKDVAVRIAGGTALAISDPALDSEARLAELETLHARMTDDGASGELLTPLRLAIAHVLHQSGARARAIPWLERILADEPLAAGIADMLLDTLGHQGDWQAAALVARRELTLKGESYPRLMTLAEIALAGGMADEALGTALAARRLTAIEKERSDAQLVFERALGEGASLAVASATPAIAAIPAAALEDALNDFARKVSVDYRMDYWEKPPGAKDHDWVARPERRAQIQLRTWLDGRFGGRVTILEEIATGAGRLDLLVQLAGGMQVILELKMLGFRYSSTYAAEGAEQILHYMENRDVRLGFLVVFDARIRDNGKQLIEPPGGRGSTVRELLIDVRPRVGKSGGESS